MNELIWDIEAEVVVLGSGGAALTAAITAHDFGAQSVVILEKSNMVGGTTAMSGGMIWIPCNHHQEEVGIKDSWDDAVTYLDALAPDTLDPELLEGFLVGGPEMVRHLAANTPVKLRCLPHFPDYQPDHPGAMRDGGRSLDNDVFSFVELGNWATRVVPPKMGQPRITSYHEDRNIGHLDATELEERRQRDCRAKGQALVGSLLKAILDRDIPIYFEHRANRLHKQGQRIAGVTAETPKGEVNFKADKGVVIATGGYEWNKDLVQTFLRGPMTGPVSLPENEGDGLIMALEVGARLGNMSNAFWSPSCLESKVQHRDAKPNFLLIQHERTLPGSIMVNQAGNRFVDEAANYNALVMALHHFDENKHAFVNVPYFLIFDQRFRERYAVLGIPPGQPIPEHVITANTVRELADGLGIDAEGLRTTIDTFNQHVDDGHDPDFHRGENSFDNYWGDKQYEAPFRTLGKLDQPPFHGVMMEVGVLGTNGGPKTNANAQVLDWKNRPIPGLYAAGNSMAAPLGSIYGGGGGTLGPALTFGYLAGRHVASSQKQR